MSYLLHELAKEGHTGVIVYLPDFCEDLKSMFNDSKKLAETIDLLKQADIVILDDIGAENLNPWFRDHVLGTILNYRMNRKPTFFTSNFDVDGLEEHLSFTNREGFDENKGKRIMERIKHYTEQIYINGYNKRYQN
jgi:primosomal protein DnaI